MPVISNSIIATVNVSTKDVLKPCKKIALSKEYAVNVPKQIPKKTELE